MSLYDAEKVCPACQADRDCANKMANMQAVEWDGREIFHTCLAAIHEQIQTEREAQAYYVRHCDLGYGYKASMKSQLHLEWLLGSRKPHGNLK